MPSVVSRKTSLTIRHRFTPASTFSTTTRALEMRGLRHLSATLNAWPLGFFWLPGQHPRRLIALQTRVLAQRRVGWRAHLCPISRLLVVRCADHRRPQRDHFGGVCVDQQEVLVRRRFLLAAVGLLVRRGVGWTLATALGGVPDPIGGTRQCQGAGGDPARVALRRHAESGEGPWQDGEHVMHPRVGLGLAQSAWQAVHGVQWIGLLVDEDEEQLVFHLRQDAFGAAAALALAHLAFPGLVWRREYGRGRSKGRQHTRTLVVRQSGRGQDLSRSVL